MTRLKPERLQAGDTVGVIAPAGPVLPEELAPGLALLEARGFRIVPGASLYAREGYLAGGDTARRRDLTTLLTDPMVKALFCARGGYGCMRLLAALPFRSLGGRPKIVVGYSDVTALLMALCTKAGWVTFHGPMLRDVHRKGPAAFGALLDTLLLPGPFTLALEGEAIAHGRARGRLLGGNLSLICHLVGTPYLPSLKGAILFLEDTGEALYRVDRMLTHLALSGALIGLAGLVLGDFQPPEDPDAFRDRLGGLLKGCPFPVATGLPVGHGSQNHMLPLGVAAELDTHRMTLDVVEPYTI